MAEDTASRSVEIVKDVEESLKVFIPMSQAWIDRGRQNMQDEIAEIGRDRGQNEKHAGNFLLEGWGFNLDSIGQTSPTQAARDKMSGRFNISALDKRPGNLGLQDQAALQGVVSELSLALGVQSHPRWLYSPPRGKKWTEAYTEMRPAERLRISNTGNGKKFRELDQQIKDLIKKGQETHEDEIKKLQAQAEVLFESSKPEFKAFSGNIAALVTALDAAHGKGFLHQGQLYDSRPPHIGGFAQNIFMDFVRKHKDRPAFVALVDKMTRDFTRGFGLSEMLPTGRDLPEFQQHEKFADYVKAAFEESGETDLSAFLTQLSKSGALQHSTLAPFGEAERRDAFKTAFDNLIRKAKDAKKDDDAAFALLLEWESKLGEVDSEHAAHYMHPSSRQILMDPRVESLDINSGGQTLTSQQVFETYMHYNRNNKIWQHEPMIFQDNTGKIHVAFVESGTKMFSIQPLNLDALEREAKVVAGSGKSQDQQFAALRKNSEIGLGFSLLFPEDGANVYQSVDGLRAELLNPSSGKPLEKLMPYHKLATMINGDRDVPDLSREAQKAQEQSLANDFKNAEGEKREAETDAESEVRKEADKAFSGEKTPTEPEGTPERSTDITPDPALKKSGPR